MSNETGWNVNVVRSNEPSLDNILNHVETLYSSNWTTSVQSNQLAPPPINLPGNIRQSDSIEQNCVDNNEYEETFTAVDTREESSSAEPTNAPRNNNIGSSSPQEESPPTETTATPNTGLSSRTSTSPVNNTPPTEKWAECMHSSSTDVPPAVCKEEPIADDANVVLIVGEKKITFDQLTPQQLLALKTFVRACDNEENNNNRASISFDSLVQSIVDGNKLQINRDKLQKTLKEEFGFPANQPLQFNTVYTMFDQGKRTGSNELVKEIANVWQHINTFHRDKLLPLLGNIEELKRTSPHKMNNTVDVCYGDLLEAVTDVFSSCLNAIPLFECSLEKTQGMIFMKDILLATMSDKDRRSITDTVIAQIISMNLKETCDFIQVAVQHSKSGTAVVADFQKEHKVQDAELLKLGMSMAEKNEPQSPINHLKIKEEEKEQKNAQQASPLRTKMSSIPAPQPGAQYLLGMNVLNDDGLSPQTPSDIKVALQNQMNKALHDRIKRDSIIENQSASSENQKKAPLQQQVQRINNNDATARSYTHIPPTDKKNNNVNQQGGARIPSGFMTPSSNFTASYEPPKPNWIDSLPAVRSDQQMSYSYLPGGPMRMMDPTYNMAGIPPQTGMYSQYPIRQNSYIGYPRPPPQHPHHLYPQRPLPMAPGMMPPPNYGHPYAGNPMVNAQLYAMEQANRQLSEKIMRPGIGTALRMHKE